MRHPSDAAQSPQPAATLAASEEFFELFFDYVPVAIAIFDREMRYLRASKRWRAHFDLGDQELYGLYHYNVFPRAPEHCRQAYARGLRGEMVRCEEEIFERADGSMVWVRWEVRPWFDSLHQVAGVIIFIEDISERKRAETALRESEQRFATVFDKASLPAMLSHLPDYNIVDVNDAFTNLFGYTKAECLGKNSLELGLRRDASDRSQMIEEIFRSGQLVNAESTLYTRSGKPITILINLNVFPLHGELYALTAMQDITEQKSAEEALRRQSEELRALAGRLQMVREEERARVARELHDQIGQNLTAIKLDLEMVLRKCSRCDPNVHARLEQALSQIREATRALRSICTQLRPSVLDDLGLAAAIEWQAREFTKRTAIPCEFRPMGDEITVDGDRSTAVFRIFQEALTNIARHAGATRVTGSLSTSRGKILLTIEDNGKGFRLHGTKKGSFGILGMRERAEACGGTLNIVSQRGLGTTVILEIPISHVTDEGTHNADRPRG